VRGLRALAPLLQTGESWASNGNLAADCDGWVACQSAGPDKGLVVRGGSWRALDEVGDPGGDVLAPNAVWSQPPWAMSGGLCVALAASEVYISVLRPDRAMPVQPALG
jgi:hypothetical protein